MAAMGDVKFDCPACDETFPVGIAVSLPRTTGYEYGTVDFTLVPNVFDLRTIRLHAESHSS